MAPPFPTPLDLPCSTSTVSVSIIDSSLFMGGFATNELYGPPISGFETVDLGAWSFLIDHPDGRLVFDLGVPVQWETDYPPRIADIARGFVAAGTVVEVRHYVSEILEAGGVPLDSIDAVIWSHTHLDHIGRPSLFPPSTDLIVGEGTLETFGRGYPDSPDSPFLARELANRTVTEISFANATRIGGLAAFDYFGDGSFYILDAPGHEIGHINALARVSSNPPSFIYMGGDSFHHSSQLRPSRHVPMPKQIYLEEPLEFTQNPVPRDLLAKLHPSRRFSPLPEYAANLTSIANTPFATVNRYDNGGSLARYPEIARDVISKLHAFDGDDRVLIVGAHDETLRGIVDIFPKTANEWRAKGWKRRSTWNFLHDYDEALRLLKQNDTSR
ncbi:hypothetical protein ACJ41O_008768 [Fusarium nematophilum]